MTAVHSTWAGRRERVGFAVSGDLVLLLLLAPARVLVHALTNGRYGLHRDELATLDDA